MKGHGKADGGYDLHAGFHVSFRDFESLRRGWCGSDFPGAGQAQRGARKVRLVVLLLGLPTDLECVRAARRLFFDRFVNLRGGSHAAMHAQERNYMMVKRMMALYSAIRTDHACIMTACLISCSLLPF